jgi:hypothetical protein
MSETLTAKPLPATLSPSLNELADKIKGHLRAIDDAMRTSIMRAIDIGELLAQWSSCISSASLYYSYR